MQIRDGSGFGSNALAETVELARTAPDMGAELLRQLRIMRGRWRTSRSSVSAGGISSGYASRAMMLCMTGSAENSRRWASTGGSEPRPLPTLSDGLFRDPAPRLSHTRRNFSRGAFGAAARYLYPAGGTRVRGAGEPHGWNARTGARVEYVGRYPGGIGKWQI